MKKVIVDLISEQTDVDVSGIESLIEVPPRLEMGDFAFPCFGLAKSLKKNPVKIAGDLAGKLKSKIKSQKSGISRVEVKGAYLNFFIDRKIFTERVLRSLKVKKKIKKRGKVLIDMSSPNIAKPFGIGHLRSTIIGNSLAKICEANGFEVVKVNYLGDWGTQFGKIILGWKKWGDEVKLKKNAIAHLQELYVRMNVSDEFDEDARAEFKKLEDGDRENVKLWEKFRKLSLDEFEKIYDLLNVSFDVISGESLYNDKMDEIVKKLENSGILKKDDGAKIVDLKKDGLGVALIQKSDGASLYITRDLAVAIDRKRKYNFDRVIYEVGAEQRLHFQQLFNILDKMGYEWSKDLVHAAHGLYLDKDGKKFSTRKGKSVSMITVLDEVIEKAKMNLLKRGELDAVELEERARKIALAAIFYGDLKNNRENNMVFDVDRFLSFEGDTGPYLLYSYARASSILRKVNSKAKINIERVEDNEIKLVKKINMFDDVVSRAYEVLAPNLIANYCFELAKDFNEFYHSCPVLGGESEGFRLAIVGAFRDVLGRGLYLLGIESLEEM